MSARNEGYPLDWARIELMVSPTGEMHAIGGDRAAGDPAADLPFVGLERIRTAIVHERREEATSVAQNLLAFRSVTDWDEFWFRHVYLAASKSKDRKTKIGAVIVRDRRLLAEGFNGLPRYVDDSVECRHERPEKYYWYCHGERNALDFCTDANGATIYTQGIPCADCARGIVQRGITEVVVHLPWHQAQLTGEHSFKWMESAERSQAMFKEAGITLRTWNGTLGIHGFVDGKQIPV